MEIFLCAQSFDPILQISIDQEKGGISVRKYKNILLSRESRVAILTLNRPQKHNTFDLETWQELEAAAMELGECEDLGAVVVNANGPVFSGGIDLNQLQQTNLEFALKKVPWLQSVYNKWDDLPVPVIAAVQGPCYGAGVEFILACDIRIAAKSARFALPEVKLGLSPDMGGTTRLTRLVGPGQAKRFAIGCEEFDAEEARFMGIVEVVVDDQQLMDYTMKLAKRMAGNAPIAVKMAKKAINVAADSSLMAGLQFEQAQSVLCCGTEDLQEGIRSFFEKRKPVFKGR